MASYTGIDIVESVIAHNRQLYGGDNVQFFVRDIIEDELPAADLCLIREVFQHLSNAQIQRVLPKLRAYRYAIVTTINRPPESSSPISISRTGKASGYTAGPASFWTSRRST